LCFVARKTVEEGGKVRRRRSLAVRIVLGVMTTFALVIIAVGAYIGISLYQINRAVHHVEVPSSMLAHGQNDLLAIVKGPNHSEEAYLFHTTPHKTNVLVVPTSLGIKVHGRTVTLSSLDIHSPVAIIAGLHDIGIPVSRYVGVDLHTVKENSSLGRLATGKLSIATLLSNPTGTTSLLEQVASHVYLGPSTSVSALLELMHVPTSKVVHVPTTRTNGNVVLADAYVGVLKNFL
jgi:hypothetical protein